MCAAVFRPSTIRRSAAAHHRESSRVRRAESRTGLELHGRGRLGEAHETPGTMWRRAQRARRGADHSSDIILVRTLLGLGSLITHAMGFQLSWIKGLNLILISRHKTRVNFYITT